MLHNKIPSLLGVIILIIGLAAGVALIGQQQIFRLGASGDIAPRDVRISNVTDNSFTVSWITARDTLGFVNWGQTTSLGEAAGEDTTSPAKVHSVTITGLSPSTNYFVVINSAGTNFDNSGVPWSISTGPALPGPRGTLIASGTILNANGSPAANALVYINGGFVSQLSTLTSANGTWTIPLSSARNRTLSSYATFEEDSVLDILVQTGEATAAAKINALTANPIPPITLGQTYDFRGSQTGGVNLPEADVNLPDNQGPAGPGGLDISGEPATTTSTVTLESIKESGEVIFTSNPEFFGDGPPNTQLTITIESEPITKTVRVNAQGTWRFSPPTSLENGTHTITIKWTDATGILRSLTRTFTVQAAEDGLGFESTPSGSTPTPTQTPSPTPSPSPSPTPTTTPTSTPSPTRASIPSTESGVPEAGSLTPTLVLATIGLLLFFSGIVITRKNI